MNGFEAIEFMKNGGMVESDEDFPRKIVDGVMYRQLRPGYWEECNSFRINFDGWYEYKEPKVLTGWERVEDGVPYTTISSSGFWVNREKNCEMDVMRQGNANYFSTREKAEEINLKQTLFRKLQRFSDENYGDEIDWNNVDQYKFCIYYVNGELCVDYVNEVRVFGQVYFITRDTAESALEIFHEDLIKYFTM